MGMTGKMPGAAGDVRRALAVYMAVLAVCFGLSTLAAAAYGAAGAGWPYDTWLYKPCDTGSDFFPYAEQCRHVGRDFFRHEVGGLFAYNAPAAFLFAAAAKPFGVLAGFFICIGGFVLAFLWLLARWGAAVRSSPLRSPAWAALGLSAATAYPVYFLADRGNIEGVIWVMLAAGALLYSRGKDLGAAVFWGLAVACKFVYLPLVLLFVPKRKWAPLLLVPLLAAALTGAALCLLGPSPAAAWRKGADAMSVFQYWHLFRFREWEVGFHHSFFDLLKRAGFALSARGGYQEADLPAAYAAYRIAAVAFFAAMYLFRVVALPRLNQFFYVVVSFLLLAPMSGDYKLVHLYLPWGFFLLFLVRDVAAGGAEFGFRRQLLVLAACAVCFTPQHLILGGWPAGGQVKCLALMALLYAAAKFPMPGSAMGDADWRPRGLRETYRFLAEGFAPWVLRTRLGRRWLGAEETGH